MLKILFHLPISFSKFCLAVFFFCISTNACAQNDNSLNNREAFKLTLAVDSASYYATEIGAGPYLVGQDILQIYPGEKVYLEANSDSGKLTGLNVVKENKNPARTIIVSFEQKTKGKKHETMWLTVFNPFDKQLHYNASIFVMKGNRWKTTNVLDILPHIPANEMWPYVIVTIALDQWELIERK